MFFDGLPDRYHKNGKYFKLQLLPLGNWFDAIFHNLRNARTPRALSSPSVDFHIFSRGKINSLPTLCTKKGWWCLVVRPLAYEEFGGPPPTVVSDFWVYSLLCPCQGIIAFNYTFFPVWGSCAGRMTSIRFYILRVFDGEARRARSVEPALWVLQVINKEVYRF